MLFHDVNPQMMYVKQQGKQVSLAEEVQVQNQKQFSFSLNKLTNLFRTKQTTQSVCCACACS